VAPLFYAPCNLPQYCLGDEKHTRHFVTGIHMLVVAYRRTPSPHPANPHPLQPVLTPAALGIDRLRTKQNHATYIDRLSPQEYAQHHNGQEVDNDVTS